jgi:hypothetical protein
MKLRFNPWNAFNGLLLAIAGAVVLAHFGITGLPVFLYGCVLGVIFPFVEFKNE